MIPSFAAMMAVARQHDLPRAFRGDLLEHDYNACIALAPTAAFVWVLYEHGTHLFLLDRPVKPWGPRSDRNTAWALVRDLESMFENCHFYMWDGVALRSYANAWECSQAAYLHAHPIEVSAELCPAT